MVFQTEKAMEEVGDKLDAADKAEVQTALDELKKMIEATPAESMTEAQVADMKAAKEKLMNSAQKLFAKVYEQAQGAAGAQGQGQPGPDMGGYTQNDAGKPEDDVVDGDYREV